MIQITNVFKQYDGHLALDNVSMHVTRGSVHGLLGPNGAGKTSLIRILNQITQADSGEILLDGKPLHPSQLALIGYLPEERGLYKKMKVADHILYLAQLRGMDKHVATEEMNAWLKRFDLTEWRNKKIETLSKGMAQKVQFISTVIHRPPLLIFDEPFSGFDPVNAENLKQEILRLRSEGATVVLSTHNMSSVEEICEDITLINKSRVVLDGRVADVRQKFKKGLFTIHVTEPVLAPHPEIYSIESISNDVSDGGARALIRMNEGASLRDAIALLNPLYTILEFQEQLPSMQEVFIETVTDVANS